MGQDEAVLVEVVVGDTREAWRAIGFAVGDDGTCRVGTTRIRLAGDDDGRGRGILGWTLAGLAGPAVPSLVDDGLDGLPTAPAGDVAVPAAQAAHPNGATSIDHIVAITPDLDRTTAVIEAAGISARRTREAGRGRLQRFFRLGEVILELVGPVEPSGHGPATFWGLTFTVADIDATAGLLGDRVGTPKPAVQPGRRITTLRTHDAVSVPMAFMSGTDMSGTGLGDAAARPDRPVREPAPEGPGRSGDASL